MPDWANRGAAGIHSQNPGSGSVHNIVDPKAPVQIMTKLINRSHSVHDNIPHLPAAVGKGVSLFIQIGHKLDYILIRLQKFQSQLIQLPFTFLAAA